MSDAKSKQRRARGTGHLFQKTKDGPWHLQYYKYDPDKGRSVCVKEYTQLFDKRDAQKLLNDRLAKVARGEEFYIGRPCTIAELYKTLRNATLTDARPGGRKAEGLEWRWAHLGPFFGAMRASALTTARIDEYKLQRRSEQAKPATVNRELATLRRMYRYAKNVCSPQLVHNVPHIAMLDERDNVRTGFIEHDAFERLATEAAKDGLWLRALIEVAFTFGWRRGELISLRVRQVDLRVRTIRLDPGTTKNDEGREVVMTAEVHELLRAACEGKKQDDYVFTREDGKPIKDFAGTWRNLCTRAGLGHWECSLKCGATFTASGKTRCKCGGRRRYAGLIVHDFRRSAAMQARSAGIEESVIMKMGGWKTPSMFRRYAIVDRKAMERATAKLEQARQSINPRNDPSGVNTTQTATQRKEARVQ